MYFIQDFRYYYYIYIYIRNRILFEKQQNYFVLKILFNIFGKVINRIVNFENCSGENIGEIVNFKFKKIFIIVCQNLESKKFKYIKKYFYLCFKDYKVKRIVF